MCRSPLSPTHLWAVHGPLSRRRPGQVGHVKMQSLVYDCTMEARALRLVVAKATAATRGIGDNARGALAAMDNDDGLMAELLKQGIERTARGGLLSVPGGNDEPCRDGAPGCRPAQEHHKYHNKMPFLVGLDLAQVRHGLRGNNDNSGAVRDGAPRRLRRFSGRATAAGSDAFTGGLTTCWGRIFSPWIGKNELHPPLGTPCCNPRRMQRIP
jgi:hypothetical protein